MSVSRPLFIFVGGGRLPISLNTFKQKKNEQKKCIWSSCWKRPDTLSLHKQPLRSCFQNTHLFGGPCFGNKAGMEGQAFSCHRCPPPPGLIHRTFSESSQPLSLHKYKEKSLKSARQTSFCTRVLQFSSYRNDNRQIYLACVKYWNRSDIKMYTWRHYRNETINNIEPRSILNRCAIWNHDWRVGL